MRLPPGIVALMAEKATERLLATRAVKAEERGHLVGAITHALEEELRVEETLLNEADRLLREHYKEVRAQGADVAELRERILKKLARERGAVLR